MDRAAVPKAPVDEIAIFACGKTNRVSQVISVRFVDGNGNRRTTVPSSGAFRELYFCGGTRDISRLRFFR